MHSSIRNICGAVAFALVPAVAGAQAKPMEMQHEEMSGWKELDAFHKVLAEAWHPVMKGDFKPARAKAEELLKAAQAWQRSTGPKSCDTEAVRAGLKTMMDDARSYADAAKRAASDDAIKATLKATHDRFEEFAESCMHGMHAPAPKKP